MRPDTCTFGDCTARPTVLDASHWYCDEHSSRGRWVRPDGSFDVLAWCRSLDDAANAAVGASPPRPDP